MSVPTQTGYHERALGTEVFKFVIPWLKGNGRVPHSFSLAEPLGPDMVLYPFAQPWRCCPILSCQAEHSRRWMVVVLHIFARLLTATAGFAMEAGGE